MEFCGYDVIWSDTIWVSSLLHGEVDWKKAEEFGDLNSNNLFNEFLAAKSFAERYEELFDDEHGPCTVWGIYKVLL